MACVEDGEGVTERGPTESLDFIGGIDVVTASADVWLLVWTNEAVDGLESAVEDDLMVVSAVVSATTVWKWGKDVRYFLVGLLEGGGGGSCMGSMFSKTKSNFRFIEETISKLVELQLQNRNYQVKQNITTWVNNIRTLLKCFPRWLKKIAEPAIVIYKRCLKEKKNILILPISNRVMPLYQDDFNYIESKFVGMVLFSINNYSESSKSYKMVENQCFLVL